MQQLTTREELNSFLSSARKQNASLGFVPTMGALHAGHAALVMHSVEQCDFTIVSLFVNRLQFNNPEDYNKYPVKTREDMALLESLDCDAVFIPEPEVMFPAGYSKIELDLNGLDTKLEGQSRPGHFDGVVQVVYRLFDYIRPDKAFFGLKDYQQCMVIRLLKKKYFQDISLEFLPTIREADGLAMSSRNARLSPAGRMKAPVIHKVLQAVVSLSRHVVARDALKYARHLLARENVQVDYFELVHADTLQPGQDWFKKGKNVLLTAVIIDGVRLIDNEIF